MLRFPTCAAIALIVTSLVACDSSKPKSATGLDAALAVTPRDAQSVAFTEWSALGHQVTVQTPALAGNLFTYDDYLEHDLGFRSVDATWEADIQQTNAGRVTVLQFDKGIDLDGVAAKLVAEGYTKSQVNGRDLLRRPSRPPVDLNKSWMIPMGAVAIDRGSRQLFVAGSADTLNRVLDRHQSLADRADVKVLAGRVGTPVSAVVSVGDAACQPLAAYGGRMPPAAIQQLRQRLTAAGPLSPFTADIVASDAAGTSGLAVLAFPDSAAARNNAKARAAEPPVLNDVIAGDPGALTVASTSVSGPVLKLALHLTRAGVLSHAYANRSLGFDVCV